MNKIELALKTLYEWLQYYFVLVWTRILFRKLNTLWQNYYIIQENVYYDEYLWVGKALGLVDMHIWMRIIAKNCLQIFSSPNQAFGCVSGSQIVPVILAFICLFRGVAL